MYYFADANRRAMCWRNRGIFEPSMSFVARWRSVGTAGSMPYQIISGRFASFASYA